MGYDIGASVGLTGEAEFKRSLQEIRDSFKMLGSEMKLAASQFEKNDKSVEALTAKNQVLGREIDLQKSKVSLLTTQYDAQKGALDSLKNKLEDATKAFGADSEEVKKAQRAYDAQAGEVSKLGAELNNSKADLNKLSREFESNSDSIKKSEKNFKALGDIIDGKVNKAFGSLSRMATIAATAIASGLSVALTDGIQSAMEAEEKVAQLDAVLASTGGSAGMAKDELLALADGFEKTTKFSAESALEAESLLLTFTNIGKDTFPRATQAAADMATAMGTDMAGQSIALGKALNDPVKGISALTRVGVTFTEEQKKAIKAMQESGDVAGAQAVILAELEKEFGGSAKAAGQTFAGKLEILKNSLGAVTEKLATTLMPYLQQLMDWVAENLPEIEAKVTAAFDGITKVVKSVLVPALKFLFDNIGLIKGVAIGLISVMAAWKAAVILSTIAQEAHNVIMVAGALANGGLTAATTALTAATGGKVAATALATGAFIAHNVAMAASAVATGVASAATAVFNAVLSANPIVLVILAIAALVAAIVLIATHWEEVTKVLVDTWKKVKAFFAPIAEWFGNLFKNAWKEVKNAFSKVGDFFGGIWDTIVKIFKKIGSTIAEGIGSAFKAVINSIISFAEGYINTFIKGINLAIGLINKIPGVEIPKLKELDIPRMSVGTRYLPSDMLIYAHQGEMIVPRSENPYANSGGGPTLPLGGTEEIVTLLQAILEKTEHAIYLDKDRWVGATAADYDAALARLERRR